MKHAVQLPDVGDAWVIVTMGQQERDLFWQLRPGAWGPGGWGRPLEAVVGSHPVHTTTCEALVLDICIRYLFLGGLCKWVSSLLAGAVA